MGFDCDPVHCRPSSLPDRAKNILENCFAVLYILTEPSPPAATSDRSFVIPVALPRVKDRIMRARRRQVQRNQTAKALRNCVIFGWVSGRPDCFLPMRDSCFAFIHRPQQLRGQSRERVTAIRLGFLRCRWCRDMMVTPLAFRSGDDVHISRRSSSRHRRWVHLRQERGFRRNALAIRTLPAFIPPEKHDLTVFLVPHTTAAAGSFNASRIIFWACQTTPREKASC